MNKTLLIFRHEFLHTIRRTGFIILTLALPVLALLAIGIFHIASGVIKPPAEVTKIGYVDEASGFEEFTSQGNITLVLFDTPEAATQALIKKDIKEYFIIPPDFISTGIVSRYTTQRELTPPAATTALIKNFISSNLLVGKVPATAIARVEAPLNLVTTTLTSTGTVAPQQGGFANFIIPGVFSLLLALAIMFSSTYVLQGLGEEKENRLMEILLSSVSTRQLITGKVLGIGAAGLFSVLLVIGPFGYTYGWAYVPDTVINKAAAFIVPLASLAICAVGIGKKTVTRWVMIPVMIFCILIAAIAGLVFIF